MFFIFAGMQYYPFGGWKDFKGTASTLEEALQVITVRNWEWWHIVHDLSIVKSGGSMYE
jgi:hypothetical protein